MSRFGRFASVVWVMTVVGCSSEGAHIEKVVPVSGTLTYQGKPLEFYQVTFMPEDGRRPATGITDAAGKFTMGTNDAKDGAPPGMNKIAVVWVGPPSKSQPGSEAIIDDPSKLPKPKVKVPDKYNDPATSGLSQDVPAGGMNDLKLDLK